jgi:hypothetical protein
MFTIILAVSLFRLGHSPLIVDGQVFIEGRPGCRAIALDGDPTRPVVLCEPARPIGTR